MWYWAGKVKPTRLNWWPMLKSPLCEQLTRAPLARTTFPTLCGLLPTTTLP
jgi:hypothetical protein